MAKTLFLFHQCAACMLEKCKPKHERAKKRHRKQNCFDLLSDSTVWFHFNAFLWVDLFVSACSLSLSLFFRVNVLCVALPRTSLFSFSLSFQQCECVFKREEESTISKMFMLSTKEEKRRRSLTQLLVLLYTCNILFVILIFKNSTCIITHFRSQ